MTSPSSVYLTLTLNDDDAERLESITQVLLNDLRGMDTVSQVDRVPDPNPPEGNMAGGGNLPGWLTVEVKLPDILSFLQQLLGVLNKSATLDMEFYEDGKLKTFKSAGLTKAERQQMIAAASAAIAPAVQTITAELVDPPSLPGHSATTALPEPSAPPSALENASE